MSTGRAGRAGSPRLPQVLGRGRGGARCPSSPGRPRPPPRRGALPAGCHFTYALAGPGAAALPRTVPAALAAALVRPDGTGLRARCGTGSAVWSGRCCCAAAGDPCGVPSPRDGWMGVSLRQELGVTPSGAPPGQGQVGNCESRPALTVWVLNRTNLWACCSFALSSHRTSLSCLHTTCY